MKANNDSPRTPRTIKELAKFYAVEPRTIRNWIAPFRKELGEKCGRYFTDWQVKLIIAKLGTPD